MKSSTAVVSLAALAQENRLSLFRALVEAGPKGLCPSDLAQKLDVAAPTLSFHLAQLRHAGLITVTRRGRSLIYATNFSAMNQLIGFLTQNCCGGDAAACAPAMCRPAAKPPRRRTSGRAA
jgi:ArsR family transcriptional regulator, arsenate/arsenite/antimonite-responsive transcriptional repressor